MSLTRWVSLASLWTALAAAAGHAPSVSDLDPIVEELLATWDSTDCLCLGEDHGDRNDSDLRIALVRHPRFAQRVRLIVVEFANPVHQGLLDRYLLGGESLTRDQLQVVWRDASSPQTWEWSGYEDFFRAVRDVNLALPRDRRVRVVGGDAAIDWSSIETAADVVPVVNRGGEMRKAIVEQVLEPKYKALAIFGCGHCLKTGGGFPGELAPSYPGRFWSVCAISHHDARALPKRLGNGDGPHYLPLHGSDLGLLEAQRLMPASQAGPGVRVGDLVDALIVYGDRSVEPLMYPSDPYSPAFKKELARRLQLTREAFELWLARGKKKP